MDICCLASLVIMSMANGSCHDEFRHLRYFLELNGYLGVVGTGCGLVSEDEVSVDEGILEGEQLACDGVINVTLLVVGYEGLAGKGVIKVRFILTGVTVSGMVRWCGIISGND